jgi:hypothetical protein
MSRLFLSRNIEGGNGAARPWSWASRSTSTRCRGWAPMARSTQRRCRWRTSAPSSRCALARVVASPAQEASSLVCPGRLRSALVCQALRMEWVEPADRELGK